MIFQALDDKESCVAICVNGELYYEDFPELTGTWDYNSTLHHPGIEYAKIYCEGAKIDEVCPEDLKPVWKITSEKIRAFIVSFAESRVSLSEHCIYDMIPKRFLLDYFSIKNEITSHILTTRSKPKNYDFLLNLTILANKLEKQTLNLDLGYFNKNLGDYKARRFRKTALNNNRISYNIYGTKTGRLTTNKNSFPILTLNKEFREIIKPRNDYLVELDYNAAELRVLLGLANKTQPEEDIHEWNIKNIFGDNVTREEAKKRAFAWLYNPESEDYLLNRAFDRDKVLKKYWDGQQVNNPYDRTIAADKHHALNYIIQSTASDLFLRKMIAIDKILKDRKTFISFSIHDSLVLDFSSEDSDILAKIVQEFSDTDLGKFKVNVKYGKNFKNMLIV